MFQTPAAISAIARLSGFMAARLSRGQRWRDAETRKGVNPRPNLRPTFQELPRSCCSRTRRYAGDAWRFSRHPRLAHRCVTNSRRRPSRKGSSEWVGSDRGMGANDNKTVDHACFSVWQVERYRFAGLAGSAEWFEYGDPTVEWRERQASEVVKRRSIRSGGAWRHSRCKGVDGVDGLGGLSKARVMARPDHVIRCFRLGGADGAPAGQMRHIMRAALLARFEKAAVHSVRATLNARRMDLAD